MKRPLSRHDRFDTGAALVIVLAFIVLLAALMVIFFAQAISYRNQGNSSANNFKSTALAQSGLETVVGDLEQEMTNGSGTYTVNYGSTTYPTNVYYPSANLNVVPQRQAAIPATIPNLIRISQRGDTIPSPGVGSRASADSSTNVAASGQYVSPARWNQHYLIPRLNAGSALIDTTPISDFTNYCTPDWVYVTGQGPQVITPANISSGTKVIGRYAYAIYDEGGLLDANVAGFPSNTATNSVHPGSPLTYATNSYGAMLPMWGAGLKGSEAFADLTVPVTVGSITTNMFVQSQIDQLVGWRNNATAQPTGTYNSYTFNQTAAVNFHDWMANATNGYLTTSGNSWSDPTTGKTDTDQVFASRQSLINFINDAGMSQDSLQYLGTFTRALEQPCYNPPVGRPMVQSGTNSNIAVFGTGNDAYSFDRASTTTNSPTDINPPFLAVRVTGTFTRADNTKAQIGEPLLKKRFPLSRLSLFPLNEAAPGAAAAALIYKYFGLTYVARSGTTAAYWSYNHDASNTAGIDRLSAVAALNREPDFFELLKAAINVGSLGKGSAYSGWPSGGTEGTLQQARDTLSALQILQIGANIIDQSKADNFPTRIQFPGDTTIPVNQVRGQQDLPYLYRYRNWITRYGSTGSLGAYLMLPELWDPYSPGSSSNLATSATPTTFRVRAAADPSLVPTATPITFAVAYQSAQSTFEDFSGNVTFNYPNSAANTPTTPYPTPVTFNAGEVNGYWGFREPTILGEIGVPSAAGTTGDAYTDFILNVKETGLLVATFPWFNPTGTPTDVTYYPRPQANGNTCIRFYLDYLDSSGNWTTYDEQVFEIQGATKLDAHTSGSWTTYSKAISSADYLGATRTDPRTSRWGYFYGEYTYSLPAIDTSNNEYGSYRADGGISFGTHQASFADSGFYGSFDATYPKQYRGFEQGYWAENSIRQTYQSDGTSGNSLLRYNRDPDGIPRRAMGGYVTDTTEGGTAPSVSQPLTGLPMAIGKGTAVNSYATTTTTADPNNPAYASRPTILHRPFRSVAELGYAFRDSPWGNINFTFPESGDAALLDVFCINEVSDPNGLVAGRLDLNTRQTPVLAAMLSGALRDKDDPTAPALTQIMGLDIGKQLVVRTVNSSAASYYGPLISRADLVGSWIGSTTPAAAKTALTPSPVTALDNTLVTGFSYDLGTSSVPSVYNQVGTGAPDPVAVIPRQRNAVMRALADVGTTRTWNLLIDLFAQSGQFPPKSSGFSNFVVEGEKHYWLHVAIDRYTGKVIDSQLEVVQQ
jgi:hypothetical protein